MPDGMDTEKMPAHPHIRAADADRDHAAALLREHYAAGRLTTEEFSERLDAALSARTYDQLDELMFDLPALDLTRSSSQAQSSGQALPATSEQQPASDPARAEANMRRARFAVIGVVVVVNLVTGVAFGFWWIPWPILLVISVLVLRVTARRAR
jgi:hypothetical protein